MNLDTLYDAAIAGDADARTKLLMPAHNEYGETILHVESRRGNAERVKFILREFPIGNLLVQLRVYKQTALHVATYGGHTEVVELLIEAARQLPSSSSSSANDDTHDNIPVTSFQAFLRLCYDDGDTALHLAVQLGHVDIVKLFLEADPDLLRIKNNRGKTPLYIAAENGYFNIVKVICSTCPAASWDGPGGANALHAAVKKRDKDSVLRLLDDAKHLATLVDDKGWTPLHYAAFHEFDSVLDAIIEAQKYLGYQVIFEDMVQTPLLVAAEKGYTSTVIRLMELWPTSSPAYTVFHNDGRNILHLAATKNNKEMIQGILKYYPEKYKDKILKQQDVNGDTPLHLLIYHGCYIPELIKHRGLDTMVRNKSNWTPRDMLYFRDDIIADQVGKTLNFWSINFALYIVSSAMPRNEFITLT